MSFTAAELQAALEDGMYENGPLPDGWWEAEYVFKNGVTVEVNDRLVTVTLESYGSGYDPDYDENYKTNIEVILAAEGRLFRKTGYHQSFTGGDFDGPLEEVKAVQKMVTVYE